MHSFHTRWTIRLWNLGVILLDFFGLWTLTVPSCTAGWLMLLWEQPLSPAREIKHQCQNCSSYCHLLFFPGSLLAGCWLHQCSHSLGNAQSIFTKHFQSNTSFEVTKMALGCMTDRDNGVVHCTSCDVTHSVYYRSIWIYKKIPSLINEGTSDSPYSPGLNH